MRLVFASLGSLGDLHPLLAVARACKSRGHSVAIAGSRGFRDYVEELGFEFLTIRPALDPEPHRVERLSHPTRGPERLLREEVFPSSRETFEDLCVATRGADGLVVGELLYVAPLVAHRTGIPWATAILSPMSFLSAQDPGVLAPVPWLHHMRHFGTWGHRGVFAIGRFLTSRWAAPLVKLRRELGMAPGRSPVFDAKFSPDLVLALFPKLFAAPQGDWPSALAQTGFPFFEQSGDPATRQRIDDFLAKGEKPVVFTLGSSVVHIAGDFYTHAARAACQLGVRAVLLIGNNPEPADLPDDVLAVRYAPLSWLFPHASVAVHHGGIGSCAEALRAGVPSLVIPFGYDQPDNASRMRGLGVARVLNGRRVKPEQVAAGLRAILCDRKMHERCATLANDISPNETMDQTINAIERLTMMPRPPRTRARRLHNSSGGPRI